MALHKITLAGYRASYNGILMLGTSESYGCETLLINPGTGWEDLGITCVFNVGGVSVATVADADGLVVVPPEATATETKIGAIVFRGVKDGVTRISADLSFRVLGHSFSEGAASAATPSEYEQWLAEVSKARDEAVEAAKAAEDNAGLIHELSVKGEQLAYDEQAYATYDVDANMLTFGIPQGVPGAYYTPSIASDGTLSWGKSQEDIPDVTSSSVLSEAISKAATATDAADLAASAAASATEAASSATTAAQTATKAANDAISACAAATAETQEATTAAIAATEDAKTATNAATDAADAANTAADTANTAAVSALSAAETADTAAAGADAAAEAANALSGRLDTLEEKLSGLLAGGGSGDYLVATEENPYGTWAQLYTFAVWDENKKALAFFSRHLPRLPEVGEYIGVASGLVTANAEELSATSQAETESTDGLPLSAGGYASYKVSEIYTDWENKTYSSNKNVPWGTHLAAGEIVTAEFCDIIRPTRCASWFSTYDAEIENPTNALSRVIGLENLDTSEVTTMYRMFHSCSSLSELDVSGFDTSQVTTMYYMFYNCSSLSELDVSGFDTSQVTTMRSMFSGCSSLEELDVSGFNTSQVTDMAYMFYGCSSLSTLDVSGFNTSQVTDMQRMFDQMNIIEVLDLGSFNVSKVTSFQNMFYQSPKLTTIYAKENTDWATEATQLTTSTNMFYGCNSLDGYTSSKVDVSMANTQDGYFTVKSE